MKTDKRIPESLGFTLIELMVVVVVIGILVAIAVPNYIGIRERAYEASVKANMHTVHAAIEEFNTLAGGIYPGDINTTVNEVNPNVTGAIGDMSLAGGTLTPPFPPNALLRPHPGFKNPFNIGYNVINDLSMPPPPVPPGDVIGCTYYSPYQADGTTPAVGGQGALAYKISAYGARARLTLVLP
ncbi:prepilin-type N-terminal cleavage/methylation domain-containing protein [candidate division WOR-3 bacterium]|nr:prepilin-type N-terminal cleavage/methylation domain-containing protein [candidate division WOR-3 bacterium]